jgi:hypothetical protein
MVRNEEIADWRASATVALQQTPIGFDRLQLYLCNRFSPMETRTSLDTISRIV